MFGAGLRVLDASGAFVGAASGIGKPAALSGACPELLSIPSYFTQLQAILIASLCLLPFCCRQYYGQAAWDVLP